MPENPNCSKFAELFGIEITAALWALLAFSGVACVFYRLQVVYPELDLKRASLWECNIVALAVCMLEGVTLFVMQ